jgi:hypothetical protein
MFALLLAWSGPSTLYAEPEEEEDGEEEMAAASGRRPEVGAGPLSVNFVFNAWMDGSTWSVASPIENLITVEPEEGADPAGQTIVKVLVNESDIVVGVRCFDDDPSGIVSYSKARDSELDEEDHVMIVFDTFQDGRSGYAFGVNPAGSRFDGLIVGRAEINSNWDALWDARTAVDEEGWSAVVRIPIKSLSFQPGLTEWGFNVERRVQRLQETSRWSGASQDFEISQTSRAGLLTDLPEFDLGLGLDVRPAVVGRAEKLSADEETEYDADISLDVTKKLGPNLVTSLTVNTDFAETEVDSRQVNLTRFDLFFPEKRAFFLEGADIFEFGLGLDEETVLPFFTRTIGLVGLNQDEDQLEIPINVGGKITGRSGQTNLGALVVNTRETEGLAIDDETDFDVPNTTMGAVRVTQNVLEESSIGLIGTVGDQVADGVKRIDDPEEGEIRVPLNRQDSWMVGADFTFRTSSFRDEKNLLIGVWGLANDRQDLDGNRSAYGFDIEYPNDLLDLQLSSIRIGDGFDPSLGFVPRNDVNIWNAAGEFNPRPAWSFVRQMSHEVGITLYNEHDNSDWVSYQSTIKPLDWQLESGDQFEFSVEPEGDRPDEPFEVSGGVDIRPGSYEYVRFVAGARAAPKRKVSGQILWEFGDFYNGDLNTLEATLSVRPSALLTLELTGERNEGTVDALPDDWEELLEALQEEDPEVELEDLGLVRKDFREDVVGVRLELNFSPELQLSSFTQLQFDNEVEELGTNNRLRWTFNRNGDLFVVYNHNWDRIGRSGGWGFVSNELPVKVQYTWRF